MAVRLNKRLILLRRSGENANIPRQATKNVTDNIVANIAIFDVSFIFKEVDKRKINKLLSFNIQLQLQTYFL